MMSSLDDLAAAPDLAVTLTVEDRRRLLVQAIAVVVALAAPAPAPAAPPPVERALRVREAAQVLGCTVDRLHRAWRTIPGFYRDDADGRLKITLRDAHAYLARQRAAR